MANYAAAGTMSEEYTSTLQQLEESVKECQDLASQVVPYDVVFRRDPMQAMVDQDGYLVSSDGLRGGLWAQGIIWSAERPLAMIDDALFAEGDTVGPYVIRSIQSDGLVVERETEVLFIPLDRGTQPPANASADQPVSTASLPSTATDTAPAANPASDRSDEIPTPSPAPLPTISNE